MCALIVGLIQMMLIIQIFIALIEIHLLKRTRVPYINDVYNTCTAYHCPYESAIARFISISMLMRWAGREIKAKLPLNNILLLYLTWKILATIDMVV